MLISNTEYLALSVTVCIVAGVENRKDPHDPKTGTAQHRMRTSGPLASDRFQHCDECDVKSRISDFRRTPEGDIMCGDCYYQHQVATLVTP